MDVTKRVDAINDSLGYWFSFIQHQKFDGRKSSLIIVGSHLDKVSNSAAIEETSREFHSFFGSIRPNAFLSKKSFFLDCCKPKSQHIKDVRSYIATLIRDSPHHSLSLPASVLLGLLGRDFSMVAACSVERILSHIEVTGIPLPHDISFLVPILQELHDIGLLFLVGDSSQSSLQVVLNISQLTNEVHQLLFSDEARQKFPGNSPCLNGILDQRYLEQILPKHITKECLIYLQYCQEISHRDVRMFAPQFPTDSTNQSFLFFPALCCLSRSDVSWTTHPDLNYSIGWLAKCCYSYDYFSPHFLHVLLLRLVFRFALSPPTKSHATSISTYHGSFQRCCAMWKTGVYWLMEKGKGLECMVELATLQDNKKGVVVITRSCKTDVENCLEMFNSIISCVMEAKAEFCHSVKPDFYLIDSTEAANYLNEDNLFAMSGS